MEEQIYVFKVCLFRGPNHAYHSCIKGRCIYRKIELKGATSLYQFAEAIVNAFGFDLDHAFGFHDNVEDIFESYEDNEVYTLFYDEGIPATPYEKSVKQSHVYKVFTPNKEMIFHFDYGVSWMFLVQCLGVIAEPEAGKEYPIVTEQKGKAPPQYQYD